MPSTSFQLLSGSANGAAISLNNQITLHTSPVGTGSQDHVYVSIWSNSPNARNVDLDISGTRVLKGVPIPTSGFAIMVMRGDAPVQNGVLVGAVANGPDVWATGYVIRQTY